MRLLRSALALLATFAWLAEASAQQTTYVPPRTGTLFTLWSSDSTDLTPGDCLQITAGINATGSGAQCGNGVSSITTDCPPSSTLTGAVNLSGLISNSRTVTGTTDPLLSTDCGGLIEYTGSSAVASTIAASGSTGFPLGYWVTLRNDTTNTVTYTPASGTINGASTYALLSGRDTNLIAFGAGTYITTGSGGTAGSGTVASGTAGNCANYPSTGTTVNDSAKVPCPPQFSSVVGEFKPVFKYMPPGAGTASGGGKMICSPTTVDQPSHWDQIQAVISILGTTNVQFALYADGVNTSTTPNFHAPVGAALQNSSSIVDTSTGTVTWSLGVSGTGVSISAGPLWVCMNAGDATVAFVSLNPGTPYLSSLIGSPTISLAGFTTSIVGTSFTQTFGTWPTLTATSTITSVTTGIAPTYEYRLASIP